MGILNAQHLIKVFGHRLSLTKALNDFSLEVQAGEFVGIMGPSGAGKSTLLNVISTIDRPTSGMVTLLGQDLRKLKGKQLAQFRREKLGFIFQDFNLVDALTVKENIALPLSLNHQPPAQIKQRVQAVSQILGLQELLTYYPLELSVGQRQRIAAARALVTEPAILFADEPTGSLDSRAATDFLQHLQRINQGQISDTAHISTPTTIIMVTHDAFTASFCKRILFIKDGSLFAELIRSSDRQTFFDQIIDMQATIGGGGRMNARQARN
ncbi:ABC transporter ATP-binding protein [Agrilactobacillus fermenti]|uniref:ABC transporter ATP-binding protein n=1 Tax=Agrilactobacillus fermenti TaxID=2586909 RepID=UPI003A5BEBBB